MSLINTRLFSRRGVLAAATALTVSLAACAAPGAQQSASTEYGQPEATASAPANIKIAVMAPITGAAASVGEPQLNFARMAVEDFNRDHGTNIELIESDTELDPAKASTVAQRLIEDEAVLAIVGPAGSQEVAAVAPLLAPADLPFVSPSATKPDLTEQGHSNFFRVVPRDDVQSTTLAELLAEQIQAQHVAIIDDQSSYGVGLADALESKLEADYITFSRESVSQDETDFSAIITSMQGDAPDAVVYAGQIASQAALIARQLQEQNIDAALVGGDGIMTADLVDGAGAAAEGAYATFFAPDISNLATARPVVQAYQERYGDVGPFGPPAYVATMVALEAIERAQQNGDLSRAGVLAEIAATQQNSSLLGIPIAFDAQGDIENASFFVYQVQNGAFAPLPALVAQ